MKTLTVSFGVEELPSGLYQAFAASDGRRQDLGEPVVVRREAKAIADASQAEFLEHVKRVKAAAGQQVKVTTCFTPHLN